MTSLVGSRVLRGPHWEGGEADGGEGYLGTVVRLLGEGEVVVLWDTGHETTCKAGRDGEFALRVFDSAPAGVCHHHVVCSACGASRVWGALWRCKSCNGCDLCTDCYSDDKHNIGHEFLRIDYPGDSGHSLPRRKMSVRARVIGIFPGAKVTRGRDWCLGEQDGGAGCEGEVEGFETSADDYQRNRVRVRWPSGTITSCRLGVKGHVDVTCVEEEVGPFYYRDHLRLLDVTRVPDSNTQFNGDSTSLQEAGPPASDTHITEGLSDSERAKPETNNEVLVVMTDSGGSDSGSKKRPEDKESNKQRQKDHEVTERKEEKQEKKEEAPKEEESMLQEKKETREFVDLSFASGDRVAIQVGEIELKQLQRGFGGCTKGMIKCIGQTGVIKEFAAEGSIPVVSFGSDTNIAYHFNPATLLKISEFHVGDTVRIKPDVELLKVLNSKVGWRPQMNATVSKVGKVQQIDKDKNLFVAFGSSVFWFAPAACVHAPCAPPEAISVGSESQHESRTDTFHDGSAPESRRMFMKIRESLLSQRNSRHGNEAGGGMAGLLAAILHDDDVTVRHMCQRDHSMINREYNGLTPLIFAALRDRLRCVMTLIELGADVNCGVSDDINKTPLTSAIDRGHEDIAVLLVGRGADPNYKYRSGDIPLHMAVFKDMNILVQSMIEHGVDVNAKNQFNETPLHMAINTKKYDIVETLVTAPHLDLSITDQRGFNALHLACLMDRPRAVELILDRDKSGVEIMRNGHSTAIHIATVNDHVECIRLLVFNGGANVNARDKVNGFTALHLACQRGEITTVEALLELGSHVNVVDNDGDTPLHLALGGKIKIPRKSTDWELEVTCRVQIANMLISAGALVDVENNDGRRPLTYGCSEIRERVEDFMRKNKDAVKTKLRSTFTFDHPTEVQEALQGVEMPCGVCFLTHSTVSLQPCQHRCVCTACSQNLTQCPLCDMPVMTRPDVP